MNMDPTLTDQITRRLTKFEESITETRLLCRNAGCTGPYRASAPYCEKHILRSLLATMDDNEPESQRYRAKYDRLALELAGLEREAGTILKEMLLSELRYCASSLHSELCWLAIDPADHEGAVRSLRETAGMLVQELRGDYALREIEELLATLDDVYQMTELPEDEPGCGVPDFVSSGTSREGIRCREKIREE